MTVLHDFTNPVMACAIESPEGDERIPLWTNTAVNLEGEVSQIKEQFPSLAVVQELIIELDLGFLPRLTATLVLPQADAIKFLDATPIQWGRSRLKTQFGYTMGNNVFLSPVYEGLLTSPDIQIGVETTINLVAQGTSGFDATRRGRARSITGTREEVIRDLLLGPDGDNPRGFLANFKEVEAEPDSLAYKLMFEEEITISSGWQTDWHMVLRIVKDARCYLFYTGGNGEDDLTIFPIDARFLKPPKYKFSLFGPPGLVTDAAGAAHTGFGPATKVYPVLSLNSPSSDVYMANIVRGMFFKGIDDATGESFDVLVSSDGDDAGGEPEARLGNEDAGVPEGGVHGKGDKTSGDGLDPSHDDQPGEEQKQRARSEVKAGKSKYQGIQVEIETLGVPEILPGETFRLEGMGSFWDRNYAVMEVTHRLGTGGYTTTLKGTTDTGIITEKVNKAFGNTGNKEQEAESDDSTTAQPSAG